MMLSELNEAEPNPRLVLFRLEGAWQILVREELDDGVTLYLEDLYEPDGTPATETRTIWLPDVAMDKLTQAWMDTAPARQAEVQLRQSPVD